MHQLKSLLAYQNMKRKRADYTPFLKEVFPPLLPYRSSQFSSRNQASSSRQGVEKFKEHILEYCRFYSRDL